MELIKEALSKARISGGTASLKEARSLRLEPANSVATEQFWSLPRVLLDLKHLEQQRIVSYAMSDPSHVAFNLLRTKVGKAMKDKGWKSLAVVSPTSGCGKTTVSLNLALSLARQTDYRTFLIDLDLKKSTMGRTLGVQAKASISEFLKDESPLLPCCVRVGENLMVGLNNHSIRISSEMLGDQNVKRLFDTIRESIRPDIIVFDLPPMLSSDDALAFLPHVDCALIIAAVGKSTANEIDECERQAAATTNVLGVVLNKCRGGANDYYNYGA